MLFALVLAVLTVAGWAMTPKLRKLTNNQALGWLLHGAGVVLVYALVAIAMSFFMASLETLALYYNCLFVVGGATVIFIGFKIFSNRKVEVEGLEVKTS